MPNDNRSLLTAALIVPIILAAAGGKWAVDATRLRVNPSASLPSMQELDSLRGYVTRTTPPSPAPVPAVSAIARGISDPFGRVTRFEMPKYLGDAGLKGVTGPPRWVVSTIMITDSRRVAVVNGEVVSPGSILPGGTRVLSIETDHLVIAEPGGARKEISVHGGAN
jgi:hypothetical protein